VCRGMGPGRRTKDDTLVSEGVQDGLRGGDARYRILAEVWEGRSRGVLKVSLS